MLSKQFKFIDLFSGIGGFHLALTSSGGDCVFASEWEKNASETYFANFGLKPEGDITLINEKNIAAHDVLCAGFPCQAFSISGKQKGFEDTRGTLFFDIVRIAKYHKPKVLFLENVKNFQKHDSGNTLNVVKETIISLGYQVYYQVLKSSNYGVPQARERVYFVCIRNDIDLTRDFSFPKPTKLKKPIRIIDILDKNVSEDFSINRNDIEMYKDELDVKCPYSPHQIGRINKGGQGERIYSIYSSGITLSAYGGGAAAKTGAYLVDNKIRKLTPSECLKMQGFPTNFKLPSSKNIAYKLLGNSVSVPVIKVIFNEVFEYVNRQSQNLPCSSSKSRISIDSHCS